MLYWTAAHFLHGSEAILVMCGIRMERMWFEREHLTFVPFSLSIYDVLSGPWLPYCLMHSRDTLTCEIKTIFPFFPSNYISERFQMFYDNGMKISLWTGFDLQLKRFYTHSYFKTFLDNAFFFSRMWYLSFAKVA